jgi:hypothetical protein
VRAFHHVIASSAGTIQLQALESYSFQRWNQARSAWSQHGVNLHRPTGALAGTSAGLPVPVPLGATGGTALGRGSLAAGDRRLDLQPLAVHVVVPVLQNLRGRNIGPSKRLLGVS